MSNVKKNPSVSIVVISVDITINSFLSLIYLSSAI